VDIQNRPIQSITPYARNPRKNAAAVAKVRASIAEFGFRQPIVVDESGIIVAGHTRYQAALDLGLKTVPVHVATGLSKAQIKAYRIADNRTASEAEWDMELLELEIEELKEMDFDLDLTGFDESELAGIDLGESAVPLDTMPNMPEGDKEPFQQMTFTLHDDQAEQVRLAIDAAKAMGAFVNSPNENSNGNAISRICETFLTAHANR
jgi:ParB-like chromosome segregation protein Spo0J